jgi:hypothetical protein
MSIPNPLDRDAWRSQLDDAVDQYIRPIFWRIETTESILEILYRNDTPFEWLATFPVFRVAEIVVLSSLCGLDPDLVGSALLKYDSEIKSRLYGTLSVSTFVADLQSEVDGVVRDRAR